MLLSTVHVKLCVCLFSEADHMTTVLPNEAVVGVSHYGAGSRGYQMCLLGYAPSLMCVLVLASTSMWVYDYGVYDYAQSML